jgi:hypothetical protein
VQISEYAKQGGFPGSVPADQTDPVAFIDDEGDTFEQRRSSKPGCYILYGDHRLQI